MNRLLTLIPALAALASSVACGSTESSTTVGPSPVRCAVALTMGSPVIPAGGGTGNVVVAAARECSWTASTSNAWITLTPPAQGQGDGSVGFTVAGNPAAIARRGTIVVGSERVDLTQEGASCRFQLDRRSFDVAAAE